MSTGEVGHRPRQVLVTTHGPVLLNCVRPEEVRVLRLDPAVGTKVYAMEQVPDINELRRAFTSGELWTLLTENNEEEGQKAQR
jgi:predicted ATP-binding protein involved in virulence